MGLRAWLKMVRGQRTQAGPQTQPSPTASQAGSQAAAMKAEARRLQEQLESVRRSIVEAVMRRKKLEATAERLHRQQLELHVEAAAAARSGREDRARHALGQALEVERQLAAREKTIDKLRRSQAELEASSGRLQDLLEAHRGRADDARAREAALAARGDDRARRG